MRERRCGGGVSSWEWAAMGTQRQGRPLPPPFLPPIPSHPSLPFSPQSVESPALAIMVPLLVRGMRHGETPIKRKTAVIIANMAKLVNNPSDATVFLPRLLPGLKQVRLLATLVTLSTPAVAILCHSASSWQPPL